MEDKWCVDPSGREDMTDSLRHVFALRLRAEQ